MTPHRFFACSLAIFFCSPIQASAYEGSFKPAWWCRSRHFQTICGGLFRPKPDVPVTHERLNTPDGDFVDVDWLEGAPGSPYVVILHGFGSTTQAAYVVTLLDETRKAGWRAVAVNARGAIELNRLIELNDAGDTRDLDWLVRQLIQTKKAERIYLVGFSVGGNRVLKWLGEKGAAIPDEVKQAVAVSAPYDLAKTARNLDKGFNKRVYTRSLLKTLRAQALAKDRQFPGVIDKEKVLKAKTFNVYDREVSAPLNGYADEREYWAKSSSMNYLQTIHVPTLLIHAANDPFLPKEDLPIAAIEKSEYLKLLLTPDGGHLGFVSGKIPFKQDRWLERQILDFFRRPSAAQ